MTSKSTSPKLFEDLPMEIFGEIFAFLSFRDPFVAFSNLNRHIDSIIRSVGAVNHVVRYDETELNSLSQLVSTSITCLVVVHAQSVDFSSLINPRSLTLTYGTHVQLNTIRPDHFPNLEVLHISAAVRLGTFEARDTWTGSTILRYLYLDMQTENDYRRLELLCPNLQKFISGGHSFIRKSIGTESMPRRRLMIEYQKLAQLETEGGFILDYCSWFPECYVESPPRFDKTTTHQSNHSKDVYILEGRILPRTEPYRAASFLIQVKLSQAYPFKIPDTRFIDPIYHPNIETNGYSCCCFEHPLSTKAWRTTSYLVEIINAVLHNIDVIGDLSHFIRADIADVYRNNREAFYENAKRSALTYGRPRY